MYVSQLADTHKPSSLQRRLAAISQTHQMLGHATPTQSAAVRTVMAGIRREKGTAQICKLPTLIQDIRRIVEDLPDTTLGFRDRALILLGFAGGFRRSELVGLSVEDVVFCGDGLVVNLRRSKTDQAGAGRKIGIPYGSTPASCPVRALQSWLQASEISSGPLLRSVNRMGRVQSAQLSGKAVALIVKRRIASIGKEPNAFSGHSLRAGLVTAAAIAGVSERSIMAQTGHRSVLMVRRYIRDGSLFRENAAARVGL
jgi:integrase